MRESIFDRTIRKARDVLGGGSSQGSVPAPTQLQGVDPAPRPAEAAPTPELLPSAEPAPPPLRPAVSIVVIAYNIPRELPRTLMSLSPQQQRDIRAEEYEIIVVDNGSSPPVDQAMIDMFARQVRLIRIENASPSPAAAVNLGLKEARGDVVGVMIDGARMATPGLLHFARQGVAMFPRTVVATLGWHLGADFQRYAMEAGYDQAREDDLLGSVSWPNDDGYRLFEIGTMDESCVNGWFAPISESNALFLSREGWALLGGMDERFDRPGGGLVNLDVFSRALDLPDARLVLLLGEATFHQIHGGISTNAGDVMNRWEIWEAQYREIRGKPYAQPVPSHPPIYVGTLPRPALAHLARSAVHPFPHQPAPLGHGFDPVFWERGTYDRCADPITAELIDLAKDEVRAGRDAVATAIARLARRRTPDAPEPQRILRHSSGALPVGGIPPHFPTQYHLAMGDAHRILGESTTATEHYRAALAIDRDLVRAHAGLASMRYPGDFYYTWLAWFYEALAPKTIVEIGVQYGRSIACAKPPTLVIGVDPRPRPRHELQANVQLFAETSDAFFEKQRLDGILAGQPVGIGFIDGLHLYEQALKDFINLERHCGPGSVILFHDTLPLDEPTQHRACDTEFHTGDVWKTVLCLKHYRPDLDVFTIATPWTGLTVVTGMDPASRILADRFDEAVDRFVSMPFSLIEDDMRTAMNVVPNDRDQVLDRLRSRRVL